MKHVVSFSGGKDSTAMLLMMLERKMPVDYILFCDTGKEFPQMYEHIKKVEQYIQRPITILKAEKSFDYYMFEISKSEKSKKKCDVWSEMLETWFKASNRTENGYGWADMRARWCTALLKQSVVKKYLKNIDDEYIEYIGIAVDEPKRIGDKKYPLFDWGITEQQALQYCYEKGFDWGGLYKDFKRVSCWCCPLKSIPELRVLYNKYPELWQELKEMDKKAFNQFRADYSVEQLERRFWLENQTPNLFE